LSGEGSARRGSRVRLGALWVDVLRFADALAEIERLVRAGNGGMVFTPNVDHVVNAESDSKLRAAYQAAELILADGQPLVWASRLLRTPLPQKISGSDLVPRVLIQAGVFRWRVYLLGGAEGVAEMAGEQLREMGIELAGAEGPRVGVEPREDEPQLIERVRAAKADVVLVGLGSPKQERFIHRAAPLLKPAVLFGVGASLDFLAGKAKRAPLWMSNVGLEWIYRLMQEPLRLAPRYLLNDPWFAVIVWQMLRTPRAERLKAR